MGARIKWTEYRDDIIRDGREAGTTWDGIAAQLGFTRYAIITRAKEIGAWEMVARATQKKAPERSYEPLPAGHPASWGAITRGTWLDGAEYRYQAPNVWGKPVAAQLVEMAMRDAA